MKKRIFKVIAFTMITMGVFYKNVSANELEYVVGKNRYETAAKISDKMSYDALILVNGESLADGLSSSGLSGTLNAPILLTTKDRLPDVTLEKIKTVNKVYLVGGEGVISKNIENQIRELGKQVIRLSGRDRYLTSHAVADEISKYKAIDEIFYVNGIDGQADAMSIAPVAAKNANPVILTNGKSTNYKKKVKSYSIGGRGVLNSSFDSFTERVSGVNRFETNAKVIEKFFDDITHVNLSKSHVLIDALTASALKQPVVLINDNSDKSILAGSKEATVFGDISQIAVNRAKSYMFNDTVVFYSQHQDDETLFAGSAIVDAIEAVGKENVYMVLITDGNESGVFSSSRYSNLTLKQKIQLRNNEFNAAVNRLGILKENIIYLNQPENAINENVVRDHMLDFETNFGSVTHITHTYQYDYHEQHLTTGRLLYSLYNEGLISDCRFFARKEFIHDRTNKFLVESVADNIDERNKVLGAIDEYKLDNGDMVREGIGYKSVKRLFDQLYSDKLVTSYLHYPGF